MIQEHLRYMNKKLYDIIKYCRHNRKVVKLRTTLYDLIKITWMHFSIRDNQGLMSRKFHRILLNLFL